MRQEDIITAIDVGTSKICTLIARMGEYKLEVIGIGIYPSYGLKKGIVIDIDETSRSIRKSVDRAVNMCGEEINAAYIGIAGSHIDSYNSHGLISIKNDKVSREEIERVVASSRKEHYDEMEELHVLVKDFVIDGNGGINNPLGMVGNRLEVNTHVVLGKSTLIQNLVKSVLNAGISVQDIILEPLASSISVLTKDEKEIGAMLVDIGGGTTDLIAFNKNGVIYTAVLPVGGDHITYDIAIGLRTMISEAERIKISEGNIYDTGNDEISILSVDGRSQNRVSRRYLNEIIRARINELINMIGNRIGEIGNRDLIRSGLVLTGGSSMLGGLCDYINKVSDFSVRLGYPDQTPAITDIIKEIENYEDNNVPETAFATGLGLLEYASRLHDDQEDDYNDNPVEQFFERIRGWFNGFFQQK